MGKGEMEPHRVAPMERRRAPRLTLRMGGRRFPILVDGRQDCLIAAASPVALRGYADIYEGEIHRARCLVVLSAPEGEFLRLTFKLRTNVTAEPAADFARG
jgi:hypothetical protein